MREAPQPEKFESALGHCLMDSDAESLRLARSIRRRSMLLSTAIQVAVLTAAVVVPLFATNGIEAIRRLGEGPIYTRVPPPPPPAQKARATTAGSSRGTATSHFKITPISEPSKIPEGVSIVDDLNSVPPQVTGGGPNQPGIPGSVGDPGLFGGGQPPPPPPPPVERKPRRISVIKPAKLLHKVEPAYPPLMRQIRKSGRLDFRAIIGTDGTIQQLTLVSGDPGFILSAQQAVLQWRYAPTVLNGEAVEVETMITVIYTMNQ